jgi:peptidoglycan/LPS O-acetylase OafA/YrhL
MMRPERVAEIDGLRAIAMTIVIAQHCALAPFGWTGVWLFYVISGYVITRTFLTEDQSIDPGPRYKAFMIRRFFRIVPVYFLYIAINAPILLLTRRYQELHDVPFLLTFTFNWQRIFEFWPAAVRWQAFEHLWTLSVEEQFYLFYPLLFLFLTRSRYLTATLFFIAIGPLGRYVMSSVLASFSTDPEWMAFAVYASSFSQFDTFLIGALIANFEYQIRARPATAHVFAAVAVLAVTGYFGCYVLVNHAQGATGINLIRNIFSGILFGQAREVFVYSAVTIASATMLVFALLRKPFMRPLASAPIALVGRISYGGYLYHALVLWMLGTGLSSPIGSLPAVQRVLVFLVAWCATVAVAYVSFRWYEEPIIRWARVLSARYARPAAAQWTTESS